MRPMMGLLGCADVYACEYIGHSERSGWLWCKHPIEQKLRCNGVVWANDLKANETEYDCKRWSFFFARMLRALERH